MTQSPCKKVGMRRSASLRVECRAQSSVESGLSISSSQAPFDSLAFGAHACCMATGWSFSPTLRSSSPHWALLAFDAFFSDAVSERRGLEPAPGAYTSN
jgi:hypothetical protein